MTTIQLLDSQFNMNNKKLGRYLLSYAEKHNLISEEQFGSRKGHKASLAVLNKRLTLDLLRQKKQAGALIVNYAKSCYDRVAHNVAILSMRRMGAPRSTVTSLFRTFQTATHNIRTAYGDSSREYTSDDTDIPLQGIAQGNGCAPAGWVCISTPIINALRAASFGAFILTALTVSLVYFACYAFVDDTDLVHTARHNRYCGATLIPSVQQALNQWEGGLRATGRAIAPKNVLAAVRILMETQQVGYGYKYRHSWRTFRFRYRTQQDQIASRRAAYWRRNLRSLFIWQWFGHRRTDCFEEENCCICRLDESSVPESL